MTIFQNILGILVILSLYYFRDKQTKIIHSSNAPIGFQDWPSETALGLGNSPPETPLMKVVGGKLKFQKILETQHDKSALVENLMEMLQCRDKY